MCNPEYHPYSLTDFIILSLAFRMPNYGGCRAGRFSGKPTPVFFEVVEQTDGINVIISVMRTIVASPEKFHLRVGLFCDNISENWLLAQPIYRF